ncbi:MAG TPA: arsenite methyltransferase [Pyrinomonadaceae bacterium]|jgi:SAM-dependent methyltransferase|nr:arsenite methyltransferase [Pyrinomonadaceae bacterium]
MSDSIEKVVKERYGAVALSGLSTENEGVRAVAEAFGYTAEELAAIPAGANMGLSCGNPLATASLREGEVVVDLGSGGGLDIFLAARKVGATGRAIGIDMTPEMIELARRNASKLEGGAPSNVEFRQATIDELPLGDASVDCVISNCVINLAPDKRAVFREIARVLKPGGRLAVSDIALKRELPVELSADMLAYVGCIAGAISVEEYKRGLSEAGFREVAVIDSGADLNAYSLVEGQSGCCSPAMTEESATTAEASKSLPVAASSCCAPAEPVAAAATSCCAPAEASAASKPALAITTCCAPASEPTDGGALHESLNEILSRYNVNDYAASVKVFAVKPL